MRRSRAPPLPKDLGWLSLSLSRPSLLGAHPRMEINVSSPP